MKTSLFFLIFCLICLFATAFAQNKTDKEQRDLHGAVKKVEIFYLVPVTKNGETVTAPEIYESTVYNRQGWMTEHYSFSDGKISTKTICLHNKRGRTILCEYYGSAEASDKFIYKYDKEGRIVERISYKPPLKMQIERIILKYDNNDNVTDETHFSFGSEAPSNKYVYMYDEQGRRISQTKFGYDGKLEGKSVLSYDAAGQLAEINSAGEKNVIYKDVYSYDDKGRVKSTETFYTDNKEKSAKTIFSYDDIKQTEVSLEYDEKGILFLKVFKQLDKYGNVLDKRKTYTEEAKKQLMRLPNDGLIPLQAAGIAVLSGMFERESYRYEYDAEGNWIKRIEFAPKEFVFGQSNQDAKLEPVRTQIRVITYYE